jgi:hypothetical protein
MKFVNLVEGKAFLNFLPFSCIRDKNNNKKKERRKYKDDNINNDKSKL